MERGDGGVRRRERERRKGWKVKLWSEKGRQLVTYVCVCECVCGSLTVMSRKEP